MSTTTMEALMSAVDAAGYVMAPEDDLPDAFGRKPSLFDFKALPATAVAIWRPVIAPAAAADSASNQWRTWIAGRFSTGATA